MEKIKAKVTGIEITKFEGQEYSTVSLRLNKNVKKMSENDAGVYEEISTPFVSMPMAAFIEHIDDNTIDYFLARKGATTDNLRIAFSDAEVTVTQTLVGANKTEGKFENTKDHDTYFNTVSDIKPCKIAIVAIAGELNIDPALLLN